MLLERSGAWPVCGVERSYLDYDVTELVVSDRRAYSGRGPWYLASSINVDRAQEIVDTGFKHRYRAQKSLRYITHEVPPKIMPSSAVLSSSAEETHRI